MCITGSCKGPSWFYMRNKAHGFSLYNVTNQKPCTFIRPEELGKSSNRVKSN